MFSRSLLRLPVGSYSRRHLRLHTLTRPKQQANLVPCAPSPFHPLPLPSTVPSSLKDLLQRPRHTSPRDRSTIAAVVHIDQATLVADNRLTLFTILDEVKVLGREVILMLPYPEALLLDGRKRGSSAQHVLAKLSNRSEQGHTRVQYERVWDSVIVTPGSLTLGDDIAAMRKPVLAPQRALPADLASLSGNLPQPSLARDIHLALIEDAIQQLPHLTHALLTTNRDMSNYANDLKQKSKLVSIRFTGNKVSRDLLRKTLFSAPTTAIVRTGERAQQNPTSLEVHSGRFGLLFLDACLIISWPFDTDEFVARANARGYIIVVLPQVVAEIKYGQEALAVLDRLRQFEDGVVVFEGEWVDFRAIVEYTHEIEHKMSEAQGDVRLRSQAMDLIRHHIATERIDVAAFLTSDRGLAFIWPSLYLETVPRGLSPTFIAVCVDQLEIDRSDVDKVVNRLPDTRHQVK